MATSKLYPFQVQVARLISPTESSLTWEQFNSWSPLKSADEAMAMAEKWIWSRNCSKEWADGMGYKWKGREYELRAVGVRI